MLFIIFLFRFIQSLANWRAKTAGSVTPSSETDDTGANALILSVILSVLCDQNVMISTLHSKNLVFLHMPSAYRTQICIVLASEASPSISSSRKSGAEMSPAERPVTSLPPQNIRQSAFTTENKVTNDRNYSARVEKQEEKSRLGIFLAD